MTVWQSQVRFNGTGHLSARIISRSQVQVRLAGRGAISAQFVAAPATATVLTWPATIPQCPILNAFSEQKQANIISFAPDVGPPKIRKRSTAASWQTSVAFRMTSAQLSDFYSFYESDVEDGSLPFTWDHPITKISYYWMFDPKDSPRVDRMTPDTFRVTFNLLRLP